MSFKFLHAADIHLDSPLRGLQRYEGAPVDKIRQATRTAFEDLVALAIEEQVAFLVIAGDLYDGDWNDYNTGLFFVKQMARLHDANIPVFLISGNHDAANKITRALRLPPNVTHFSHRRAETVELEACNVAIHGRSFARQAEHDNLAREYPPPVPGRINIGVLHTSLTGAEGHEPYAPCTVEDLRAAGFDYWALGHVHTRQKMADDPLVLYPGNLQGRHIRETGEKGEVLATVDSRGRIETHFRTLDVFRWDDCSVDLTAAEDDADVLSRIERSLNDALRRAADRPLAVRIRFTGICPLHREVVSHQPEWTRQVQAIGVDVGLERLWIESVRFETQPVTRIEPSLDADGPLSEIVSLLQQLPAQPAALDQLAGELEDLRKKLPAAVVNEARLDWTDHEQLIPLVSELESVLMSRLMENAS